MTPRKKKQTPNKWNPWTIAIGIAGLIAIPTYLLGATVNTPEVWIKNGVITNHLTGEFYVEACNNADHSLAWNSDSGFSAKLVFRQKSNGIEFQTEITYPLQNTTPNPGCSIIHGTLPIDTHRELKSPQNFLFPPRTRGLAVRKDEVFELLSQDSSGFSSLFSYSLLGSRGLSFC